MTGVGVGLLLVVLGAGEGSLAPAPVPAVTGGGRDVAAPAPPRTLLATGVASLAVAYGVSAAVAANSARDRWLYAPLLGPYLDLAGREACGAAATRPCYREAGNALLLATDGIIQTVGAAAIIFAAVRPAPRAPRVQVGLAHVGRRPVLAALGRF